MYTILNDRALTRRKRINIVLDEDNVLKFSASALADCLNWILAMGQHQAILEGDDEEVFTISFVHSPRLPVTVTIDPDIFGD